MEHVAESSPKIEVQDFDKIRKLYLASKDGVVAGHVVTTPNLEGVKITDLYVAPEARQQGVASSLIDEVKKRNKGNTLILRARPYGVKGPKLEKLKEMYRKLGFEDESKAEDRLIMKVAATHRKEAFGSAILSSILGHHAADAIISPLVRRSGVLKRFYTPIARAGLEKGWSGRPSALGVAAQSFAGLSPTLSGTADYGFNAWVGSQLRNQYQQRVGSSVQQSLPDLSSVLSYLKTGNPGDVVRPLKQEVLQAASPAQRSEAIVRLNQAQKGLQSGHTQAVAGMTPELQALFSERLNPTSPLLQHTQAALFSQPNSKLENIANRLQKIPYAGRLFNSSKARDMLISTGASSAVLEAVLHGVHGALGGLIGSTVSTLPTALLTSLADRGKYSIVGAAKGRLFNEGLRLARHGSPRLSSTLMGMVEPAAGETIAAGRDIGKVLSSTGLRKAIPQPATRQAVQSGLQNALGTVQHHIGQMANVPMHTAIANDIPGFQRVLNFIRSKIKRPMPNVQPSAVKVADFAEGLPDPARFGDVTKLPKAKALQFVIQEHLARRAGRHLDVRMGTPELGLMSWATKKDWPGPGGKILLHQQPVHRFSYGDFQGVLPTGYGAGTVRTHDKGAVVVTKADTNRISFIVAHHGSPEYYTMIRQSGVPKDPKTIRQAKTQGGSWLLINTTPVHAEKFLGLDTQAMAKLKYKKIPAEDVEKLFTKGNIIQDKVDGASMLFRLFEDKIEAASYRIGANNSPIIHTHRLFGLEGQPVKIPKEHVGTVLRGEAYGTREGKPIPVQELGGILNASLLKSLEKQRAQDVKMKTMLFDVAGEQDKPYAERLAKLEAISRFLPSERFHLPESARTPEEARALWEKIKGGQHSRTSEGIIAWPPEGVPTKAKILPESDVWIREIVPGENRLKDVGAGGFGYSLGPMGNVVGRVGTGFSEEARKEMLAEPEKWIGRLARIRSQGQFPGGAHRAPAFLALHEDYPVKTASLVREVKRRSHVD